MTLYQLNEKYCFHDSLITSVLLDKNTDTVEMKIFLCNFMQDNYKDGEAENSILTLRFSGITDYRVDEYDEAGEVVRSYKDSVTFDDEILDAGYINGELFFFTQSLNFIYRKYRLNSVKADIVSQENIVP